MRPRCLTDAGKRLYNHTCIKKKKYIWLSSISEVTFFVEEKKTEGGIIYVKMHININVSYDLTHVFIYFIKKKMMKDLWKLEELKAVLPFNQDTPPPLSSSPASLIPATPG